MPIGRKFRNGRGTTRWWSLAVSGVSAVTVPVAGAVRESTTAVAAIVRSSAPTSPRQGS